MISREVGPSSWVEWIPLRNQGAAAVISKAGSVIRSSWSAPDCQSRTNLYARALCALNDLYIDDENMAVVDGQENSPPVVAGEVQQRRSQQIEIEIEKDLVTKSQGHSDFNTCGGCDRGRSGLVQLVDPFQIAGFSSIDDILAGQKFAKMPRVGAIRDGLVGEVHLEVQDVEITPCSGSRFTTTATRRGEVGRGIAVILRAPNTGYASSGSGVHPGDILVERSMCVGPNGNAFPIGG